jgi:vacuolar-type H+-ATPase subunit D/Vma8
MVMKPATMQMVERLDNGLMPRAVERLHNIEEIMEERDRNHAVEADDAGTDGS